MWFYVKQGRESFYVLQFYEGKLEKNLKTQNKVTWNEGERTI